MYDARSIHVKISFKTKDIKIAGINIARTRHR